jgi:predicted dehydrogenase
MSAAEQPMRWGIVGIGLMGRGYFRILSENPHARVAAVCDTDPARLEPTWYGAVNRGSSTGTDSDSVLRMGGAGLKDTTSDLPRAFANWRALVKDPNIDAVAITAPTAIHSEVAVAALRAGKHVLCEKPMALTVEQCDAMLAAEAASGRTLMIDQCVRFFPQYEVIKRYVDEGRIGKVRYAGLWRLGAPPSHCKDNWMLDSRISGGALYDLHIHDVDFAQQLLGLPAQISARGCVGPSGGIDHVISTYHYADGRYASLEGGWSLHAPFPFDFAITVHGDTGTLTWTASKGLNVSYYRGQPEAQTLECRDEGGTRGVINYFIDCVRAGQPVARCTAEEARDSFALAVLEKRSIETGAPVDVAAHYRPAVR